MSLMPKVDSPRTLVQWDRKRYYVLLITLGEHYNVLIQRKRCRKIYNSDDARWQFNILNNLQAKCIVDAEPVYVKAPSFHVLIQCHNITGYIAGIYTTEYLAKVNAAFSALTVFQG